MAWVGEIGGQRRNRAAYVTRWTIRLNPREKDAAGVLGLGPRDLSGIGNRKAALSTAAQIENVLCDEPEMRGE